MRSRSGFRIVPDWSKIGKMTMMSQFADMTSSSFFFFFFWRFFVSLVKCSYWSKFHVNITASSEIQKSEIPASELCPISGDWDWLLNAAKCQSYNFYHFWVIKRKPTGWGEGVKKNSKIVSLAPNFISWRRPEIC